MGLVDTLHSVAEDCCQEWGELTGVRPLKSKPDASKKSNSRFSRAALKVLKDWLDEHQQHPYPTEDEKAQLGRDTGLRVAQINTWLANARRRGKAGKNKAAMDGLPEPTTAPTAAIGIPGSTNIEINRWSDMNPLERWKHSPPQNEPAPFTAIADALGRGDLPDYAEESSSLSTLGYQGLGSSRDDSRSSNRRAASVTSLEKSTSNSAASSAAWSGSRDSWGSYSSFGSSLNGRKERRRRRRMPSTVLKKPANDKKDRIYQCTFCTDAFRTKYDWTRHEKSLHLSLEKYMCCPLGPETLDTATGQRICAYCSHAEPTKDHIESHNHRQCVEKGVDARTFYRKDHLRQHLRLVHDSKLLPHMETWKISMANVNSRCGFCSQKFTVWAERNDHLAAHFKNGARMSEWKGCRGLDPAVAAQVNTAMPPYLIGIETSSINPFSATQPESCMSIQQLQGGTGPTTCWEILTIRLGRFAKEQTDKGIVLTDEMLQKQARQIIYDSDDSWDHTAADNPEWLDLFKRAHALDYIPREISGTGNKIPDDLEVYTDLGMRIPFQVRLEHTVCTLVDNLPTSGRSSMSQSSPKQCFDSITPATFQSQDSTPLQLDTPQNVAADDCFDADIDVFLAEAGYQVQLQPNAGDLARQQNAMSSQQYGLSCDMTPQQAQHQLAELNAAMAGVAATAASCGVSTAGGSDQLFGPMDYSNLTEAEFSELLNSTTSGDDGGIFAAGTNNQLDTDIAFITTEQEKGMHAMDMTMQDVDLDDGMNVNFGDMDFEATFDV